VDALSRNGPLRASLDPDEATDTVWTLTSAEVHRLLTRDRGWSAERYVAWLIASLRRLLLPDDISQKT
jgi:hypothetical protein